MRAAWLVGLVMLAACGPSKAPADASAAPRPSPSEPTTSLARPAVEAEPLLAELTFGGVTFKRGDKVGAALSPGAVNIGTVKPEESGHARELEVTPGLTGSILGFRRIENYRGYGMTVELAVVQWDAQTWHEQADATKIFEAGRAYTADELAELNRKALIAGPEVALPSFTSTINVSYLQK